MIRLPNELYRFKDTILANFVTILRPLGEDQTTGLIDLHQQLS